MTLDQASELIRHTLILTLIIASPILLIGLVVGVLVSIFQAVTQIQEQTLSLVPKIFAMIVAVIFLMPWVGQQLMAYAAQIFSGKI